MSVLRLSDTEQDSLRGVVRKPSDAKSLKRAQALLALASGEKRNEIATRAGVTRTTIYQWAQDFRERKDEPMADRLRDRPRSGRPPEASQSAKEHVSALMERSPGDFGYRHTAWTVPLLLAHLRRVEQVEVSDTTLRRVLHDLGYRWKRPRYVLSRRPKTWRQSKGGFSEG